MIFRILIRFFCIIIIIVFRKYFNLFLTISLGSPSEAKMSVWMPLIKTISSTELNFQLSLCFRSNSWKDIRISQRFFWLLRIIILTASSIFDCWNFFFQSSILNSWAILQKLRLRDPKSFRQTRTKIMANIDEGLKIFFQPGIVLTLFKFWFISDLNPY